MTKILKISSLKLSYNSWHFRDPSFGVPPPIYIYIFFSKLISQKKIFPIVEWNLKPTELDGDSLSYNDMMERSVLEERRRERERNIMQEGKALWLQKKQEQLEVELKEQEDVSSITNFYIYCLHFRKLHIYTIMCWLVVRVDSTT